MKVSLFLIGLVCIGVIGCQKQNHNSGWRKVYKNDASGKAVFGDKDQLLDAVRLGYPVRIGWGGNRVEHTADAQFLTILDGKEVFGQITPILGQAPRVEGDSMMIRFREENHWTMIAGTNGYFTALLTNYLKDSIVGGGEDRYRATTWYALYPEHDLQLEPRPLWREESPNWESWKNNSGE